MTLQEFIDENRGELDACIRNVCGPNHDIDDEEREMWINNDEGLYNWAVKSGVDPDNMEL
jgi:hypothetical protein